VTLYASSSLAGRYRSQLLGYKRKMRAAAQLMRERGGTIVNVLELADHEPYHPLTMLSVLMPDCWP
jgi:hypothetical protein